MNDRKIRALIADDESLARKFIRRILSHDQEIDVVGECSNGSEALAMIKKQEPDVVFLDIQMPAMDGFAVLEALRVDHLPAIVFTTAHEAYAIRAFEHHAVDYLLKPFDQARVEAATRYVKERFHSRHHDEGRLQVEALLQSLKAPQRYLDRIIIKADGRIRFLETRAIDWIEADDKYVHLHTGEGARMVRQTLNAIETDLDPKRFARIHRSAIVNIERIEELQPLFSGEYSILLENGTKLTLSRTYKDRFFELLGKSL